MPAGMQWSDAADLAMLLAIIGDGVPGGIKWDKVCNILKSKGFNVNNGNACS